MRMLKLKRAPRRQERIAQQMRSALTADAGRVGSLFRACEDIAAINRAGVGAHFLLLALVLLLPLLPLLLLFILPCSSCSSFSSSPCSSHST